MGLTETAPFSADMTNFLDKDTIDDRLPCALSTQLQIASRRFLFVELFNYIDRARATVTTPIPDPQNLK